MSCNSKLGKFDGVKNIDGKTASLIISKMKKYSVKTCLNLRFADLTTLAIGGKIKITVFPDTERKLIKTLRFLKSLNVKTFVMGKGSNVLAGDGDYLGAVVVTCGVSGVKIKGNRVKVLCGTSTVNLGKILADHELSGGEFFSCLPATVGGAVGCNAGCFSQDASQITVSVNAFCRGKVKKFSHGECKFVKRGSIFKNCNAVIISVTLRLQKGEKREILNRIKQMRQKKADTQPLNMRSAGSVFFHQTAAISYLLDQAGLKGYSVGGAQISAKHAGFIVNTGGATCKDFLAVSNFARDKVFLDYGVLPKMEITLINTEE